MQQTIPESCVGTDDTAKRCNQSCISIMADLNHLRTITEGKGQGSGVKALKEHTGPSQRA